MLIFLSADITFVRLTSKTKFGTLVLQLNFESQPLLESVKAVAPIEASPGQTQLNVASCDPMPLILPPEVKIDDHEDTKQQLPTPKVSSELQPNQDNKFAVPDLNLPLDDDCNS